MRNKELLLSLYLKHQVKMEELKSKQQAEITKNGN